MNRNEYDVEGPQIELAAEDSMRYFDLYHGVELDAREKPGRPGCSELQHRSARIWSTPGIANPLRNPTFSRS